MGVRGRLNR
uniref:Uncharacterized protein n=1 Tax=Nothobranchius kuhntae TaxID=321403 RepID=A0A1A8KCY1_NOTKU